MNNHNIGQMSIALGIMIAGFFLGNSVVSFKKMDRSVDVRGLAERIVDSDQAIWQMTFSASSEQMADVNGRVLQLQGQIIKFILEQGFSADEIEKDPISIQDKTTQAYGNEKGPRFIASGGIKVNTMKVAKAITASQKTDELLKQGVALSSSNINYYFTNLNSIKPAMLEEATRSAREAAKAFAKDSGAEIGGIRRASQGLFTITSPLNDYASESSVKKKVRVVTQMDFYLE